MTKQPTPFTELYFSDPGSLPKPLSVSSPNLFQFTVVNREGHDTLYYYTVTLVSSHSDSTIARGRVELTDNQAATRIVNVRPTEHGTVYWVSVYLKGQPETIRFRSVSQ